MRLIIQKDYNLISKWVANHIASRIKLHSSMSDRPFVLGLPTGSSPKGTYKELIRMYQNKDLSFKNVITFNMDEYVGIPKTHLERYHTFMYDNFFNEIDIPKENINILNGNAEEVVVIINGHLKARALQHVIEGNISHMWTITALQSHNKAIIVCDEPATYELKVSSYRYFLDIEAD